MSSKQVLLLTVRSLTALPKVHSSRNSCDLVKALNLLKNLSTATERSEFHNPNVYNIDDSPQYGQNPTESQSCKDSRHTLNRQGSNATGGFPQGPISDHGWNPVAQNGNHAGVYGQSYGGSQQNSDQNSSDGYREDICGYQNNFQGQNGTISGYNVQNSWNSNQNPNRFYTERQSFKDFQPNTNSQGINPNGHIPQGSVSDYGWNPVGQNVNHGGVYGQSYGAFQQNWYQNSSEGYRESTSTFNGYNVQNNGDMKQNPGGVYMESSSGFEQGSNHFDRNHVGAHVEVAKNSSVEEFDGLVKEGKVKEAVEVLGSLEKQRVPVDLSLIFQLMEACGEAKALEEAKGVHEHISRSPFPVKVSTYNRILKMYSKCGSMNDAFDVFNNMRERNLTTWDTMIAWLAKNGLGEDAIDLFSQFKQAGLKPDGQIFIGVFSACSVLGDIHEGLLHFKSMSEDYGIIPSMKHYVSIVDMLGSTGYLDEALEFIEKMPMEPSVDVWETLMNLSRTHGNFELGDRCAEMIEQLDPSCLNEKSKAGLIPVDESELLREKEKKKLSSQNLLEIRSRVHEYRAGDTSHPETDKIYAQIRGLKAQMKEAGYIPETRFVLHDIDQEGKEEALLAHSERLAVSHGLLSSPARAPIRIIKNLRVCGDCHSALKIISKIVGRELIIRDAKRFHHFKDGLCSCRDYW